MADITLAKIKEAADYLSKNFKYYNQENTGTPGTGMDCIATICYTLDYCRLGYYAGHARFSSPDSNNAYTEIQTACNYIVGDGEYKAYYFNNCPSSAKSLCAGGSIGAGEYEYVERKPGDIILQGTHIYMWIDDEYKFFESAPCFNGPHYGESYHTSGGSDYVLFRCEKLGGCSNVYYGTKEIKHIYYGNQEIKHIFYGKTQIF